MGQPQKFPWVLVQGAGLRCLAVPESGGDFTAGPLVPGVYSLVAYPKGGFTSDCPSDAVEARPGDEDLELRLRAGGKVVATIFDGEGKPARLARASLISSNDQWGGWGGETDKNGRAECVGVPP